MPPTQAPDLTASGLCAARRALFASVGVAGVALVAGCGGEPLKTTPTDTPGQANSPTGGASGSAKPTGSTDPGTVGGGGNNAPQNVLTTVAEVPVGGGVVVRGPVLVVQPKKGTFKAYNASCPHQGVTVDAPAAGATEIVCPGHNSRYDLATGAKRSGPTPRGLAAVAIKVDGKYIVPA